MSSFGQVRRQAGRGEVEGTAEEGAENVWARCQAKRLGQECPCPTTRHDEWGIIRMGGRYQVRAFGGTVQWFFNRRAKLGQAYMRDASLQLDDDVRGLR